MSVVSTARLGLGLAAVGRPAYLNLGRDADLPGDRSPAALEARTHQLLDAAAALGIDHVDTARSYGRGEEFLASWLASAAVVPWLVSDLPTAELATPEEPGDYWSARSRLAWT